MHPNARSLLSGMIIAFLVITASGSQGAAMDIKTFVRAEYEHGIPYGEAAQFEGSVTPTLLNMLKDPQEKKWWGNIIATLGIIGDERAVAPLIDFLEHDIRGEVDPDLWGALLAVPQALGHIAARGDDKALNYLVANTTGKAWQTKRLPWTFQGRSGEKLYTPLIKSVIISLGISSQPRAIQVLEQMQIAPDTPEEAKSAVSGALKLADEIKTKGRMGVFGHRH